jgi:hypothetical protein
MIGPARIHSGRAGPLGPLELIIPSSRSGPGPAPQFERAWTSHSTLAIRRARWARSIDASRRKAALLQHP